MNTQGATIAVYSIDSQKHERLTRGAAPAWLNDARSLLYVKPEGTFGGSQGGIHILDRNTKQSKSVVTPNRFELLGGPAISPDGRTLFYSVVQTRADLWMITLP